MKRSQFILMLLFFLVKEVVCQNFSINSGLDCINQYTKEFHIKRYSKNERRNIEQYFVSNFGSLYRKNGLNDLKESYRLALLNISNSYYDSTLKQYFIKPFSKKEFIKQFNKSNGLNIASFQSLEGIAKKSTNIDSCILFNSVLYSFYTGQGIYFANKLLRLYALKKDVARQQYILEYLAARKIGVYTNPYLIARSLTYQLEAYQLIKGTRNKSQLSDQQYRICSTLFAIYETNRTLNSLSEIDKSLLYDACISMLLHLSFMDQQVTDPAKLALKISLHSLVAEYLGQIYMSQALQLESFLIYYSINDWTNCLLVSRRYLINYYTRNSFIHGAENFIEEVKHIDSIWDTHFDILYSTNTQPFYLILFNTERYYSLLKALLVFKSDLKFRPAIRDSIIERTIYNLSYNCHLLDSIYEKTGYQNIDNFKNEAYWIKQKDIWQAEAANYLDIKSIIGNSKPYFQWLSDSCDTCSIRNYLLLKSFSTRSTYGYSVLKNSITRSDPNAYNETEKTLRIELGEAFDNLKISKDELEVLKNRIISLKNDTIRFKGIKNLELSNKLLTQENELLSEKLSVKEMKDKLVVIIGGAIIIFLGFWSLTMIQTQRRKAKYLQERSLIENEFNLVRSKVSVLSLDPHIQSNLKQLLLYIALSNDLSKQEKNKFFTEIYSPFFESKLELQNEQLITIEQELNVIELYLKLLKYMFNFDFQIIGHCDPKYKIPPLILQPLIENIFKYGMPEDDEVLKIIIEIKMKDTETYIAVIDNGKGIDLISFKKGTGISSVIERLNIYNRYFTNGSLTYSELKIENNTINMFGFTSGSVFSFNVMYDNKENINNR